MSNQHYPEEFKIQSLNQVTEKQLPVSVVGSRLGVTVHNLYAWIKRYTKPQEQRVQEDDQSAELSLPLDEVDSHLQGVLGDSVPTQQRSPSGLRLV